MQQNGSSGSNGHEGCSRSGSRERQSPSLSPLLPSATTRVRRFIQERRTLPLPRVMVVFSGTGNSEKPSDAMSSSDSAEDDFRKPPAPSPNLSLSKPLRPAPSPQEEQEFPEVISLNVGGMYFTTRLSTLRRYEDTMLAAMFSGRHYIPRDPEGRYFIDRDGKYFGCHPSGSSANPAENSQRNFPKKQGQWTCSLLELCCVGHPELPQRGRTSPQEPGESGAQGSSVLLHRPPAGQPGGHSTADRRESTTGLPGSAALLQRQSGAHRRNCQTESHAEKGTLRQT
ncbi:BTB/POZ domain-containing protein KCTD7 isoform X2 [Cynoglossus semilaevis]|uniref:BTB/POZ domain-containing protein KCTD7 isoform X2 n=1 Tax=Cynoglossus semilaevis TaxID=244447 RepID=UPI000497CB78|nr:BTB/POZ domain-containing protein KCTD7 isoform X2 [Cynoglossus semilaevis]